MAGKCASLPFGIALLLCSPTVLATDSCLGTDGGCPAEKAPADGLSLLVTRTAMGTTKESPSHEGLVESLTPDVHGMHVKRHQNTMPEVAMRAFDAIAEEKRWLLERGSMEGAQPMGKSVFEAVEVSLPLEPPVLKHSRMTGSGQGDKNIVGLQQLTNAGRQCVVYGIGIADDSSFEQQMQTMGCETHAFDCTVDPSSSVVKGRDFKFHRWCIGQKGNVSMQNNIYVKDDPNSFQFKSLPETMKELGHSHIDLLKFDIEGFEWQLFETQILKNPNPPEQLSFELHTQKANPAYVPQQNVKDKGYPEVNKLFRSLHDIGYRVTSKEINSGDPACAEFVAIKIGSRDI